MDSMATFLFFFLTNLAFPIGTSPGVVVETATRTEDDTDPEVDTGPVVDTGPKVDTGPEVKPGPEA